MENRWLNVLLDIQEKVSVHNFNSWIKPIKFLSFSDENKTISLIVPNKFFRDWIRENFMLILEDSVGISFGKGCRIEFHIDETQFKIPESETAAAAATEKKEEKSVKSPDDKDSFSIRKILNPRYTFDTFVKGKSNEFSHAAALAVADSEASKYNPLFIYSDVGLGKTHLVQAICHKKLERNGKLKVCYYSSENFTNELINSIRYEKMEEFRNKFRKMDVLLIDDIQFIAGKERTQEEFFHTFNTLHDARKQIVITSDKLPNEIPDLEVRLKSRFEWGLICDIQHPDVETKVAILKKKADIEGVHIPNDVAFFISSLNENSNIRKLEGYLLRTIIFASLKKSEITLDIAKDALKEFVNLKEKVITVEDIQRVVSSYYNIKESELKSTKKLKQFVKPRHIAMFLCRELTNASFPEIGTKFGGKDHSTIIYAHKTVEKLKKKDNQIEHQLKEIMNFLKT